MLKRNVVVRSKATVSVTSEEKRVTDFVVVLLAIHKRLGGQKARPQKRKIQKSKNRKACPSKLPERRRGGGYDQEMPLIRSLRKTQASGFLTINNQVKILTFA